MKEIKFNEFLCLNKETLIELMLSLEPLHISNIDTVSYLVLESLFHKLERMNYLKIGPAQCEKLDIVRKVTMFSDIKFSSTLELNREAVELQKGQSYDIIFDRISEEEYRRRLMGYVSAV